MTTRLDQLVAALPPPITGGPEDADRAQAAVALILGPDPDRLLLIRRAERAGDPWSGHLALPGGRREPEDADLLDTAIRETREEVGLTLERDNCRATLDDLLPRIQVLPHILVRPFVFVLPQTLDPGLSAEVVAAEWVALAWLLRDGVLETRTLAMRGGPQAVQGYALPGGFLWGMTERIVTPVLERWRTLG
ncbi:MAG TPA: CoA pyrophosphatase [Gemmatimonadales bacterium]|nr:CoA pyrophosphatase [Gemmatimonadales bacterium]